MVYQKIVRSLVYIGTALSGYFLTKCFFPTPEDQMRREANKNPQKKDPEIIKDPEPVNPNLIDPGIRGGFSPLPYGLITRFIQMLSDNRYLLMGLVSLCGVAVADRYRLVWAEILVGASPALTGLPSPLIKQLLHGFAKPDVREMLSCLKQGLTSKELSIDEKLALLKRTIGGIFVLIQETSAKRKLLLSILLFLASIGFNQVGLFGGGLICLQDILTKAGIRKASVDYIISIYQEYNAPIPKELFDVVSKVKEVKS